MSDISELFDTLSQGMPWRDYLAMPQITPKPKQQSQPQLVKPRLLTELDERILDILCEYAQRTVSDIVTDMAEDEIVTSTKVSGRLQGLHLRGLVNNKCQGKSHIWAITQAGRIAAITPRGDS